MPLVLYIALVLFEEVDFSWGWALAALILTLLRR